MPNPTEPGRLLGTDEPPAFLEMNADGRSGFVITVDHASARIPRRLADLGVPAAELARHIAWDIGALEVARRVSAALDAPLVAQNYSRLVIDCNRDPQVATSIPPVSEYTAVPGNADLCAAEREARRLEIFEPYHARIRAILDARAARGQDTILIAQHSMTPRYKDDQRAMHAAILYNRDRRFAGITLDLLRAEPGLVIADNQPYFVSDETDYTVPRHGEARGLAYVEIEIRQDLVTDVAGQEEWGARLARVLSAAERIFTGGTA
jgi:predicted N-formylglutamate amidohydrolase